MAQEHEQWEDDIFQKASNITPDALWNKHCTKGPPALPHSIGDLLQLFDQLIVLTEGLFMPLSSMTTQLRALQLALQKCNQTLMGNPDSVAELIPQLV